jgi:hypothetical protein
LLSVSPWLKLLLRCKMSAISGTQQLPSLDNSSQVLSFCV